MITQLGRRWWKTVKRLVVKTSNPDTLFEHMHEKGTSFYAKVGEELYKVVYFATNREIWFEGTLTDEQLKQLKDESTKAKSIQIDEFAGEIIVEE